MEMLQLGNVHRKFLFALTVFAAATGARAQLVVNGGFENPTFVDNAWHFVHTNGTQLTGWSSYSSNGGPVLFNGGFMPVAEGKQAVELEVPGDWISQTFETTAGANYRLSFDLSAYTNYGGPGMGNALCPCESLVDVGVGSMWTTFVGSSDGYSSHTLDFTADSSSTALTFMNPISPAAFGNYPHLDNVSVYLMSDGPSLRQTAPIPEPETYALFLAGLAFLRWRTAHKSSARQT